MTCTTRFISKRQYGTDEMASCDGIMHVLKIRPPGRFIEANDQVGMRDARRKVVLVALVDACA